RCRADEPGATGSVAALVDGETSWTGLVGLRCRALLLAVVPGGPGCHEREGEHGGSQHRLRGELHQASSDWSVVIAVIPLATQTGTSGMQMGVRPPVLIVSQPGN